MRRQQHDLFSAESLLSESGEDFILKLGPHDHEIEAEDEAAVPRAFQQNGRNFDGVEDCRDGGLTRSIARQPDLTVSRGHVA